MVNFNVSYAFILMKNIFDLVKNLSFLKII